MMNQPNPTLYIKNIDWKIKKPLLRRALYSLFSRHGKVLEVVALRKDGLRGQAFVIMEDVHAATKAMQSEQGFTFFGKDMVIEFAKSKSDRIAKRDGEYVPKHKRQKTTHKKEQEEEEEASKEATTTTEPQETAAKTTEQQEMAVEQDTAPPSKILLAQNLPTDCNEMMLAMLFQQHSGFKEVRLPRPGLAFVEFESVDQATQAKMALSGFKLTPQDTLQVIYGKE